MPRLNFNDPAPALTLPGADGVPVALASLWAAQPLVLAFVRHFGCSECHSLIALLREGQSQLAQAGLHLAVVTQGSVAETAVFARQHAAGLRLLADPQRAAYAAYGLERGNWFQLLLSPRVWPGLIRSRRAGRISRPVPPGQDVRQLSGTFVIGPDGRVRLPYYYDNITDHPPLDLLLNGVLGAPWRQPFDGPVAPVK